MASSCPRLLNRTHHFKALQHPQLDQCVLVDLSANGFHMTFESQMLVLTGAIGFLFTLILAINLLRSRIFTWHDWSLSV
jgi:hypothetical protein